MKSIQKGALAVIFPGAPYDEAYVAQELQRLLHAGTTYARGLCGILKLPDSFLIYYQLQQKSPTGTHSVQDRQDVTRS